MSRSSTSWSSRIGPSWPAFARMRCTDCEPSTRNSTERRRAGSPAERSRMRRDPSDVRVRTQSSGSERRVMTSMGLHLAVGAADDVRRVENERHAPVAEDGGAGEARHLAIVVFEALQHDLVLAEDVVDAKRGAAAVRLENHEESLFDRGLRGLRRTRVFIETDDRQVGAADVEHGV